MPPGPAGTPQWYAVRALVDSRYDLQRLRISVGHRRLRVLRSWVTELSAKGMDDAAIAETITQQRIDRVHPAQKVTEREVREVRVELAKEVAEEEEKAKKDPSYRKRTEFPEMVASKHTDEVFRLFAAILSDEERIEETLEPVAKSTPTGEWLLKQRGIASVLASGLLAYFDPTRARHASSYWKFAGLAPGHDRLVRERVIHPRGGPCRVCDCRKFSLVETIERDDEAEVQMCACGHAAKEPGKKAEFSQTAKVMVWRVADSFIKSGSPYKRFYDEAKAKYLERWGTKAGQRDHAHKAAIRVMVKRFLIDFWKVGRMEANLPVDDPYIFGPGGHTNPDAGV